MIKLVLESAKMRKHRRRFWRVPWAELLDKKRRWTARKAYADRRTDPPQRDSLSSGLDKPKYALEIQQLSIKHWPKERNPKFQSRNLLHNSKFEYHIQIKQIIINACVLSCKCVWFRVSNPYTMDFCAFCLGIRFKITLLGVLFAFGAGFLAFAFFGRAVGFLFAGFLSGCFTGFFSGFLTGFLAGALLCFFGGSLDFFPRSKFTFSFDIPDIASFLVDSCSSFSL